MVKKTQLPIIRQREIKGNAVEVSFDLSDKGLDFKAGQYIQISVPKLLYPDPRGNSRVFSIVSSPNNMDEISIAFRNSESSFKRTLIELPVGSSVNVEGPSRFFTLPKKDNKHIVFIVGGIGITPCLSMIRSAKEDELNHKITLLYSN